MLNFFILSVIPSTTCIHHYQISARPRTCVLVSSTRYQYKSTHVQSASWADVWPNEEWGSAASRSEYSTSTSILTPAEWKHDSQNYWTCQTCMDSGHHRPQIHSDKAAKTSSLAPSPASPLEEHSASTSTSFGLFRSVLSYWFTLSG